MFRWRNRSELDFADEIEAHIDHEADRMVREGVPRTEALAAARLSFGSVARARKVYDTAHRLSLERLFEDVRYSLRTLRLSPGFTIAGITSLALGIGFNTALFSTLYGLMMRPLPLPDAGQVV